MTAATVPELKVSCTGMSERFSTSLSIAAAATSVAECLYGVVALFTVLVIDYASLCSILCGTRRFITASGILVDLRAKCM